MVAFEINIYETRRGDTVFCLSCHHFGISLYSAGFYYPFIPSGLRFSYFGQRTIGHPEPINDVSKALGHNCSAQRDN